MEVNPCEAPKANWGSREGSLQEEMDEEELGKLKGRRGKIGR